MNKKLFIIMLAFIAGHSNVYSANSEPKQLGWQKLEDTQFDDGRSMSLAIGTGAIAGVATGLGAAGLFKALGNDVTSLTAAVPIAGLSIFAAQQAGCNMYAYCKREISKENKRINGEYSSGGIVPVYNKFLDHANDNDNVIHCKNGYYDDKELLVLNQSQIEWWETPQNSYLREHQYSGNNPERYSFRLPKTEPQEDNWFKSFVLGKHNKKIVARVEAAMNNVRDAVKDLPKEKKKEEVEGNDISRDYYQIWFDSSTEKFTYVKPELG